MAHETIQQEIARLRHEINDLMQMKGDWRAEVVSRTRLLEMAELRLVLPIKE